MSINDTLKALNITLPEVAIPAAAYLPYMKSGKLVFLSGHIAKQNGQPWVGKLGENITTEEGKLAARAARSAAPVPDACPCGQLSAQRHPLRLP